MNQRWHFGSPLARVVIRLLANRGTNRKIRAIFSIKLQLISDLVKRPPNLFQTCFICLPVSCVFLISFLFVPLVSPFPYVQHLHLSTGNRTVDSDKCPRIYNNLRLIYCPAHSLRRWVRFRCVSFRLIGGELCVLMCLNRMMYLGGLTDGRNKWNLCGTYLQREEKKRVKLEFWFSLWVLYKLGDLEIESTDDSVIEYKRRNRIIPNT